MKYIVKHNNNNYDNYEYNMGNTLNEIQMHGTRVHTVNSISIHTRTTNYNKLYLNIIILYIYKWHKHSTVHTYVHV